MDRPWFFFVFFACLCFDPCYGLDENSWSSPNKHYGSMLASNDKEAFLPFLSAKCGENYLDIICYNVLKKQHTYLERFGNDCHIQTTGRRNVILDPDKVQCATKDTTSWRNTSLNNAHEEEMLLVEWCLLAIVMTFTTQWDSLYKIRETLISFLHDRWTDEWSEVLMAATWSKQYHRAWTKRIK